MAPNFLERNVTFWGMVGAVMVALKLKDRYDECQYSMRSRDIRKLIGILQTASYPPMRKASDTARDTRW